LGNFGELGPWRVGEDLQLHRNSNPWNRRFGLLFIDSPAGSGFSVPPSPDAIVSNEYQVARDLYAALVMFFSDSRYKSRPLYVTGESYAGKYVPALGYYIISQLKLKSEQPLFELRGVAIGNGLTHPIVQVQTYGATAYYMGLVDKTQQRFLDDLAEKVCTTISSLLTCRFPRMCFLLQIFKHVFFVADFQGCVFCCRCSRMCFLLLMFKDVFFVADFQACVFCCCSFVEL
jgi:carboxypeptidase C (cathepsin A)